MSYASTEMSERLRRIYAPTLARGGMCKQAVTKIARDLKVRQGRAFNLFFGRAKPTVEEIDHVREMDGVWCREERKAKPNLMERMHDKIEDMHEAFMEWREERRTRRIAAKADKQQLA